MVRRLAHVGTLHLDFRFTVTSSPPPLIASLLPFHCLHMSSEVYIPPSIILRPVKQGRRQVVFTQSHGTKYLLGNVPNWRGETEEHG